MMEVIFKSLPVSTGVEYSLVMYFRNPKTDKK